MKTTINLHDFRRGFEVRERTNFSYEGLATLFNHFEEMEDDCGIQLEYDPIAICCDYTEYNDWTEFKNDYPDIDDGELKDSSPFLWVYGGGFIIINF